MKAEPTLPANSNMAVNAAVILSFTAALVITPTSVGNPDRNAPMVLHSNLAYRATDAENEKIGCE